MYLTVNGLNNISATVIEDTKAGNYRAVTLELVYPRFIHAELLRHREFSHSVSSSRAIPTDVFIKQLEENPAMPIRFGSNQAGMTAGDEIDDTKSAQEQWTKASVEAIKSSNSLKDLNIHKQITNRITEPFQMIKEVMTGTGFLNFFALRIHEAAQPELYELASCIYEALDRSTPRELNDEGDIHIPYMTMVKKDIWAVRYPEGEDRFTKEEAIKISMSGCAQASYRKLDLSMEKANRITDGLVYSTPVHASPAEHILHPFTTQELGDRARVTEILYYTYLNSRQRYYREIDEDITTEIKDEIQREAVRVAMSSGNICGYNQHRKFLRNETSYEPITEEALYLYSDKFS